MLTAFTAVAVAVQLLDFTDDQMNMIKAIAGLACLGSSVVFGSWKFTSKCIGIAFFLSILMSVSILYNENARFVNILWIWAYMGSAMLLYEYGVIKIYTQTTFYAVCALFFFLFLTGGLDVTKILTHGSANHVSILCIYCMSIYYLSLELEKNDSAPLIPIILVIFLSIVTGCRSGIVAAALFLLLILKFNWKNIRNKTQKTKYIILLIIGAIVVIYAGITYLDQFSEALTSKMDKQGMESARSAIWKEYFSGTFESIESFLFGVPTNQPKYPNLYYYSGNPHNSFLMLHAKYGLAGLLFFGFAIVKAIKKAQKNQDYILKYVIYLIVVRCFFDWTAFPGLYDVFFFYMVFYAFYNKSIFVKRSKSV